MRRTRARSDGVYVTLAAIVLVAGFAVAAAAQGFGTPSTFGATERPDEFTAASGSADRGYFIHDQAIKIAIVGGLTVLAVLVLAKQGFRHRRWLLLLSIGLVGVYLGGVLCPVASVQNVFLKWNTGYLLLFAIPILGAVLVGRVFCGTVCPFGAVQELLHVKRWSRSIPTRWRRGLSALKYLLLVYLVVRVLVTNTTVLDGATPFKALFTWGGTVATIAWSGFVAALSVVLWRPFCRFLCPLGALLSLVSRFSLFRLEADSACVACGRCTDRCPAGACDGGRIRSADCFLCGACIDACPVASLRLVRRGRSKKVPSGTEHPR